ncbi:MAG: CpsB/CapC family capsule biosynthesis tyrosine phosphatase [Lachnospiraceae bacterium]
MKGYIDVHCHILPGVDDGARDMEMARMMLLQSYQQGFCHIFLTPHFGKGFPDVTLEGLRQKILQVQEIAGEISPELHIYQGQEFCFSHDIMEGEQKKQIVALGDSRYVLVEFWPEQPYVYIRTAIMELVRAGYWPIVAHVERYACLHRHTEYVKELINLGAYIQVNSASFGCGWFRRPHAFVRQLIAEELVDFVATDAHSAKERRPDITAFVQYMERMGCLKEVDRLLVDNPSCILEQIDIREKGTKFNGRRETDGYHAEQ